MDQLQRAWTIVSKDLGSWLVFTLAATLLVVCTCGLGVVLLPNAFLAARDAVEHDDPPDPIELLTFDRLLDLMLLAIGAVIITSIANAVPVLGPILVTTVIFFAPMLIIEGKYTVIDAIHASFTTVKHRFGQVFVFVLLVHVTLAVAAFFCVLPLLLALPVVLVAAWITYDDLRDEIMLAADEAGIRPAS